MSDINEVDLCEAIVDCWENCNFAQEMLDKLEEGNKLSMRQRNALLNIWDKIPDHVKEECGYDEGPWE